ncbi:YceI family protein [Halarcobacter sp.]|uniref:YceI family protein n=1 Tax=Halarcobacter sp. TaxID=2321133 RepID=UPI002AA88A10|nr:YceI family protein [Halarcobacter sp.]
MSFLGRMILGIFFGFSLLNAAPYMIDKAHSEVGFSVKHLMISNVKGDFTKYEGEIDFDPKSKTFNKLNAVVSVNSIDTGIEDRDNHLKSADFFYAQKFPNIIFNMKTYEDGKVIGELTMRGVTKEVELEVEELATVRDLKGNNRVGFSLKGKVNRMDYGLKWNKALEFGGVAVGEDVKILIEVEAVEKK